MKVERAANDEATFKEVLELLVTRMHPEVGQAPLDEAKTIAGVYGCLAEGIVFNARDDEGKLVGSLGAELGEMWWYSTAIEIYDRWLYVVPEARFEQVAAELLRALRAVADERKLRAYVAIANPNRRKRHTLGGLVATIAGFSPLGHIQRIRGD